MHNTTTAILPAASFYCRENSSDKEYHMQVAATGGGYVVQYQYGRRGATLTPGIKPAKPVPLDQAVKQFDRMVKERIAKSYTRDDVALHECTLAQIRRIKTKLPSASGGN